MTTRFLGVVAALAFVSVLAATAPAGAHHRPGHGTTTTSSTTTTSTSTTTTTESTTTTTAPTTTTTAPPVVTSEGDVAFHFWTKSATNFITDSPTEAMKQFMRDNYADALVFSPYWDSKLAWYPRGLEYTDVLGITESERTARPDLDAAILRDTDGNRVWIDSGCSGGVCARYAMDVGNATYRAYVIGELQDKVDRGYPGLWLDDVNLRIVGTFSDGTANITDVVNPDTGLVFTLQEWQERFVPMLEQVRTTFPTQEIWHNAIWYIDQTTLADPEVDRQIAAADGIMVEHGCNDGGLVGGTGNYSLRRLMQQVDRIHGHGADVVWNDESTSAAGWQRTPTQNEHNLACYLQTANGTDMVGSEAYGTATNPGDVYPSDAEFWDGFRLNLGSALGRRYDFVSDGQTFIRRDFTGGFVVTREPGLTSATFPVPAGYHRIDGSTPMSITLAGRTSAVLVKASL